MTRTPLPLIIPLFLMIGANAMADAAAEMKTKDAWVAEHLSERGTAPFSFFYDERASAERLPAWKCSAQTRALDAQRTERTLSWTDPATGLEARCVAIEYKDLSAVEWLLTLTNNGRADSPLIEKVQALDVRLAGQGDFIVRHSLGDSNSGSSFQPVDDVIKPDRREPLVVAPTGGRSTEGHMPYFNISLGGEGVIAAIGWPGQWRAEFAPREGGTIRVACGQERTHFVLHAGESVRAPRIILVFWNGNDDLRGNNLFRRLIMTHHSIQRDGHALFAPIAGAFSGPAAPDGSYEKPNIDVLPTQGARGIEVFWFDMNPQHWYGEFPNDTGTWEPHPVKFPRGLKPLGDAVKKAGMQFLLWFEPERVHPGTKTDKLHPEWVMKPAGEWSQLFALHVPEARRWLTDTIDAQITAAQVDWVRWDFNISPLGFWRRADASDRQGITEIRYVEGLYSMWEELMRRHPGLVIDICASGGKRLDFETRSYGVPLWTSDRQCDGKAKPAWDQLQNSGLWRWVPMHGCGQFAMEPDYAFRSSMTSGNILCAGRDGQLMTNHPACADIVRRTVAVYKRVRPFMLGDFYPLFPHDASESQWFAYQFHRPDLNAGMATVFRREQCAEADQSIPLRALDPAAKYEVTFEDSPEKKILTGKELSALKVHIGAKPGSTIVYYRKV